MVRTRARTVTVALVGPDGAGKSTIGRQVAAASPEPFVYIYMGVNLEASNLVLPTTRLLLEVKRRRGGRPDMAGPGDPLTRRPPPVGALPRVKGGVKATLRLLNLLAEEWFRQLVVWMHRVRGRNVLFDRHFYADYYFHDVTAPGESVTRRLHGRILQRWYPKPDLVICLDAPAEVVWQRKPESDIALLERRRQEYLALGEVFDRFVVVDAAQPLEETRRQVATVIASELRRRRGEDG
jgi:thymidylate kinase